MNESDNNSSDSKEPVSTEDRIFYDRYFGVNHLSYPYPKWNPDHVETFNLGPYRKPIRGKSQDYLNGLVCCAAVYFGYDRKLIEQNTSIHSEHHLLNLDIYEINHLGICSIRPGEVLPDLGNIRNREELIDFLLETVEDTTEMKDEELQYITLVPFYKQICDPFSPFGVKDDSYFKIYYGSLDFIAGLFDGFSWLNYPVKGQQILDLSNYKLVSI